jgi:hypothetical protein
LLFSAQTPVPKTQHFDSTLLKPGITLRIEALLEWQSMLGTVQLDIQPRFKAEEVQHVITQRTLTTKLVRSETAVPQPTPHQLFGPGVAFAEHPGHGSFSRRLHRVYLEKQIPVLFDPVACEDRKKLPSPRPHPGPTAIELSS